MAIDEDNPALRYAPFMTVFGASLLALSHAAVQREPGERGALELVESTLATFFLTRVIARERVGATLREPFVEPKPGADPHDAHGEVAQPTGHGLRYSVGELITCPRCLGPWAGAAVAFGAVFAPRHARSVTRVMALAGANSFLHAAHAAVCAAANRD